MQVVIEHIYFDNHSNKIGLKRGGGMAGLPAIVNYSNHEKYVMRNNAVNVFYILVETLDIRISFLHGFLFYTCITVLKCVVYLVAHTIYCDSMDSLVECPP